VIEEFRLALLDFFDDLLARPDLLQAKLT